MEELVEKVRILATEELKNANKKFPMFNSMHEGWAVIKEEMEEVEEEVEYANRELRIMWSYTKENKKEINKNSTLMHMKSMKEDALRMAAEAIQVAAMAQKFIDSEVCK